MAPELLPGLQKYRAGRCVLKKPGIVFDQQHGRAVLKDQLFYLLTGEYIDVIERFIPDIKMRGRQQAGGDQDFFLLPFRIVLHIFVKLPASKIQLPQNGKEQTFIQGALPSESLYGTTQEGCILADIGDDEPGSGFQSAGYYEAGSLFKAGPGQYGPDDG